MAAVGDTHSSGLTTVEGRRSHNASNRISRLNYDILLDIFMLNTIIDLENPHIPSKTTRLTSQVQHSWRGILLGCPMLWAASLDLADPLLWINEVISRSGTKSFTDIILPSLTPHLMSEDYSKPVNNRDIARNGPKSIPELLHLLASENISDARLSLAVPFIYRSRRFFAKIKKDKWAQVVENVSKPSPTIHTFSLVIKGSQQSDQDFTLPRNLFDNYAPQLRVLDLRGCGCYLDSPIFYNLTTLIIRKPSSLHIPTPDLWLGILANMTKLCTLELTGAFSSPFGKRFAIPNVSLPHLTSLTLLGNLEPCCILFTNLDFPLTQSCMVDVRCYRTRLDDYFYSMVSYVSKKLESLDKTLLQNGLTLSCTPTGLGFTCRRLDNQQPGDTIISFDWFSSYAGPNIMAIFPAFIAILKVACPDVPQLRVDVIHSAALSDERIVELLQLFQQVKKLHLAMSDTIERLLPAMNVRDTVNTRLPFPLLETIVLEHAFQLGERVHGNEVDGLTQFVRSRRETQHSIKHVVFSHCGHVFATANDLEALGVDVTLCE